MSDKLQFVVLSSFPDRTAGRDMKNEKLMFVGQFKESNYAESKTWK